ncbi:MAG: helical backbone metal receptor [Acidimicrobiia bacterium]
MRTRRPHLLALAAFALLVAPLAACSDDDDGRSDGDGRPADAEVAGTAGAAFPVTVAGVTVAARPERIVSLSPTATEVLYAIGAGTRIVGLSTNSTFPEAAPDGDLDAFEPDLAVIASKSPDLIVTSQPGKGLESLGVPVIVHEPARSLDEAYAQITELGRATDLPDAAAATIQAMKDAIAGVVSTAAAVRATPAITYYYEVDPAYSTSTSKTFIGDLLGRLGLQNIADTAPGAESGHPQLSSEFVVAASPELVVLADVKCCWQSTSSATARSGWEGVRAVGSGAIVGVDDDVASTWGPRAVGLLAPVADAAAKAAASR